MMIRVTLTPARDDGVAVAEADRKPPPQPETAAPPPSTEPAPGQAGEFDGTWVFEFAQMDGPFYGGQGESSKAVVETKIVSNKLSLRFKSRIWEGEFSGSIDESGTLVGSGWAVRTAFVPTNFEIKAVFIDGAFQAEFIARNVHGAQATCRIALTPVS